MATNVTQNVNLAYTPNSFKANQTYVVEFMSYMFIRESYMVFDWQNKAHLK